MSHERRRGSRASTAQLTPRRGGSAFQADEGPEVVLYSVAFLVIGF